MNSRYLLFLQNNYSNEQYCFEVFNSTCDPGQYVFQDFNDTIPADFPYGTYDAALLHCSIPYSIEFKPCLLDTVITAGGSEFTLRDLRPETFLFEFKPDGKGNDVWDQVLGNDRLYIDM